MRRVALETLMSRDIGNDQDQVPPAAGPDSDQKKANAASTRNGSHAASVSPPRGSVNGKHRGLNMESMLREAEIRLVQQLFFLPVPDVPRMVVFASVEHGNGCSRICARAAETLAHQVPGSVCVVDANLRSPSLHRYFGVESPSGLVEAIFAPGPIAKFAQQLPGDNLWVLPCGSVPADPHALLTSHRLRSRMAELQAAFDYVLIDAPPVSPYTDAILLGQLADGVVLVVEANSTHRQTALKAKESLESANSRLLAAVLNKRTFPIPESIYPRL